MNKENFIANFPFGIIFHDTNGRITYANKSAEEEIGLSLSDIKGKTWQDLPLKVIKRDGKEFSFDEHPVMLAIKSGEEIHDVIIGIFNPVKEKYVWLKTSSGFQHEDDDPEIRKRHVYLTFSDISDKVKAKDSLSAIIKNANLGTWEWNINTGETEFNDRWAEIVGYSLKELSPVNIETWIKLTHPDDLKNSNEKLKAHFDGKTAHYRCEARMRHKNGQWVWVLDTGKVTEWTEDGKPLLMSGVHQEITERKKTELQLYQKLEIEKLLSEISSEFIHTNDIDNSIIESFSKLAALTHASRVYLFMIDEDKGTMSNTHEWCAENVSAEKDNLQNLPLNIFPWWMKKLYRKEIIDIPDVSKMPPEAKEEQEILESQSIKSLLVLPVYIETQLKGFVGFDNVLSRGLWSEKYSQLLRLLADIISNAIDRKINEEELRLLKKAVEESPVSILITDFRGAISYTNSAFERITGFKAHDVLGKNPSILNSGKQPKSFYAELWDTILAGNIWQGELRNKSKNGKIFWTRQLISPIKHNNKITHFVGVAQDISENKKVMNELFDAKLKAEESDRLKSAFLATMSHELRTPLNHVLGFSDMIPDMTDNESIKEYSVLIHKSGTNLLNIIEDIFNLALIEQSEISLRKQEVFIRDIYLELKNQLREVLTESNKSDNIRLKFKIDSSIVTKKIITDKPKVMQVMSNIIKNAIKFTNKGEISLSLILEEDNYLAIKVKDTGIGIPNDKLGIIFEFFRQVDDTHTRNYEGVGIGLAISQKIAQVMGGTIKVESTPDIGSEFTFSFFVNLLENKSIDSQQETTSFSVSDFSEKKMLIAEDDIIGMGMIMNMLTSSGFKIICASNGKEALKAIKNNPDIDIVLMDLKMPVMDGFEATRTIRKDFSDLPIIALTAYSLQKDKKKALDAGCNGIITKPINKEILLKKLQEFMVK